MSQCNQILGHMKRHGTIDPLTALNRYGCYRLAARINDLRHGGWEIATEIVTTKSGKRYARYRLSA